jgi:hypothetical protein
LRAVKKIISLFFVPGWALGVRRGVSHDFLQAHTGVRGHRLSSGISML